MDSFDLIGRIAASGVHAQRTRLQVIAENLANADSTASKPGGDPYRRKTITFAEMLGDGASQVKIDNIGFDTSPFELDYDPAHPAADEDGYVKRSNVNPLVELADMREASNSVQAALNMIQAGRRMKSQLIGLIE
jgi:flagellar basal-body rod protein FlgC